MESAPKNGTRAMTRRTLAASLALVGTAAVVAGIAMLTDGVALARHGGPPASGHSGASVTSNTTAALTCGTATTPVCPTTPPYPGQDWVAIPADTPANVLAAFQRSGVYQVIQQSNATGVGDAQYDLSRPETPVFVRELHAPGGKIMPDVWVIAFDIADGEMGAIAICDLNDAHTAVNCGSVSGGPARPHGQLARFSQTQAVSMVEAQSHVTLRSGAQPYLVYAPIDATLVESGKVAWNGGGSPGDPLWLVPCSDGLDRVVGTDGKVYLPAQIPVVKAS